MKSTYADDPAGDSGLDSEKVEKMAALTVAAARGLTPVGQVILPLAQIAHSELAPPDARALARALTRVIHGERDPVALAADLSPTHAEILWETLAQIEAPLPAEAELSRQAFSFEELIEKVAEACSGEVMLWQRLWAFTEELSADDRVPADVRALGTVLRKILAGERQKHVLVELSPAHRDAVEQLLDWLIQ
jgi:hypothetical protein